MKMKLFGKALALSLSVVAAQTLTKPCAGACLLTMLQMPILSGGTPVSDVTKTTKTLTGTASAEDLAKLGAHDVVRRSRCLS